MSSCDRERIRNSESLEFPIKKENEDSFPQSGVKMENNIFVSDGLFKDGSYSMDPEMKFKAEPEIEFKAEPETFDAHESDLKYSFISDASVNKEDLQINKREVSKEEESVKRGVKDECGIQLGSSRKEDKGKGRENGWRECLQKVDLEVHYETHSRKKPLMCSDCGKVFPRKSFLIRHLRTHTGEKPYKCNVCDKSFPRKSNLTSHYRIHTGEKPFKCSVCDKAFTVSSNLTSHYRIHTGEKPFKCSVCDKAFTVSSHLTSHYRIHSEEKPFKCGACDKAFSNEMACSTHEKICRGKLFECNECGKAFTQKYNFTRHLITHTGDKPFRCSDCNKAFARKSCLARHVNICARGNS
ncbi:zinc finger protein 501-like [Palaemon carinicauda]|uniref:zinc finger protein 501-like n=1 Tax=Palaemon carinicauda TaxID=392227 RepID=UPI0035B5B2FC